MFNFLYVYLYIYIFFFFKENILSFFYKINIFLKLSNFLIFFNRCFLFFVFFKVDSFAEYESWLVKKNSIKLGNFSDLVPFLSIDNRPTVSAVVWQNRVPYTNPDLWDVDFEYMRLELLQSWIFYDDFAFSGFLYNFFFKNSLDSLITLDEDGFVYWYSQLANFSMSNSSVWFFSEGGVFYFLFSIAALLSTLFLFLTPNPVNSILHLVLVFLNVAFLILLLEVEYLALTFMIVYIGAISMLFVFVIMMLDIRKESLLFVHTKARLWYKIFGFFLFLFILGEFYLLLFDSFNVVGSTDPNLFLTDNFDSSYIFRNADSIPVGVTSRDPWNAAADSLTLNKQLFFRLGLDNVGHFLYTYYFVYLYLVGFILLVPMLGAIVLTNRMKEVCFFNFNSFNFFCFYNYLLFVLLKIYNFFFFLLSFRFNFFILNLFLWFHVGGVTTKDGFDVYPNDFLCIGTFDTPFFFFGYTKKDPAWPRCAESYYSYMDFGIKSYPGIVPDLHDYIFNFLPSPYFLEHFSKNILESISIGYLLMPGFLLFIFGIFSLAFVRKHILIYLMAIEIMLLGISLMLIIFSLYWCDPCGDILVLLILCVAAAEVVIALAIAVAIYRNENSESIAINSIANLRF